MCTSSSRRIPAFFAGGPVSRATYVPVHPLIQGVTKSRVERLSRAYVGNPELDSLPSRDSVSVSASYTGSADRRRTFDELLRKTLWTNFRPDLASFKVPTLIVHGTGDESVPIDTAGRAAAKGIANEADRVRRCTPRLDRDAQGAVHAGPARLREDLLEKLHVARQFDVRQTAAAIMACALGAHQRARALRKLQGCAPAAADASGQPHRGVAATLLVACFLRRCAYLAPAVKITAPDAYGGSGPPQWPQSRSIDGKVCNSGSSRCRGPRLN